MSLAELESAGRPDFDFEAAWRTVFAILKFSAFLTAAEAGLGPLDMLVNNAGIMPTGLFSDEDSAMTARMVDINVNGVLTGSRLAVERFRPRGSGHLVNIASLAGVTVLPGLATYCGTKRFVIGFTETLERELRADGIAVTLVLPGVVRTELSAGTRMPKWMTGISTVDPVLRERYHRRLTGGAA
ncbi:SDR family NAD(P)-dependent oxidoreductase [Nocardia sp. NEAU-G5]|uniref:SDR family NAD(P)-dependent oxidoreductase n=1 Tax=Nocardia albiluteola TaxID=2842303 RepID=A0ABS6BEZ5_9NOCA|nr:SDR family NAD(P)-dependent oxidoreductase [Nocardia albiluteola]